jgi:hypothetical protein
MSSLLPIMSACATFVAGVLLGRLAPRNAFYDRRDRRRWTSAERPLDDSSDRYEQWLRQRYTWNNSATGITLEQRDKLCTGTGLWLRRGYDEVPVILLDDELVLSENGVVTAASAPRACILVHKRVPGNDRAYNFSRLVVIELPVRGHPLSSATVQAIIEESATSPRFWISELENISEDGTRVLVKRGDESTEMPGFMHVNYRTFRLNLANSEWAHVTP